MLRLIKFSLYVVLGVVLVIPMTLAAIACYVGLAILILIATIVELAAGNVRRKD